MKSLEHRKVHGLDVGRSILCASMKNKMNKNTLYKRPELFGPLEASTILENLQVLNRLSASGILRKEQLTEQQIADLSSYPELDVLRVNYVYDAARFLWLRQETEDDISHLLGNVAYSLIKGKKQAITPILSEAYNALITKIRYDIAAEYNILLQ